MKYRNFYKRNETDESWRFEDEPENVTLLGTTLGCGCCSKTVPVSEADLQKHVDSLREKIVEAEVMLNDYLYDRERAE